MRIVHVLSLLDPQMSFGGPTRVALNQLRGLQQAGHEVLLVTGVQGFDPDELTEYDGVPVKAFRARRIPLPGLGFAGLIAPQMLLWLLRVRLDRAIVHVHLARDLISTPAAWMLMVRRQDFITQTHGMIDASANPLAKILDAVIVRKLLRTAKAVLALTDKERQDLLDVEPVLRTIRGLPNGLARSAVTTLAEEEPHEVLFLARINERKRPLEFVRAARQLASEFPQLRFTLTGPDGGQLDTVRAALAEEDAGGRIHYAGAVAPERVRDRMREASVYVLPSVNEPFPMTVLEALSAGVPVVTMTDCGLAPLVQEAGGEVVGYGEAELAEGIRRLLTDRPRRKLFAAAAPELVEQRYGMDRVIVELTEIYAAAQERNPLP